MRTILPRKEVEAVLMCENVAQDIEPLNDSTGMDHPQDPVPGSCVIPHRPDLSPFHWSSLSVISPPIKRAYKAADSHEPQTSTSLSHSPCPPPSSPVRYISASEHPNLSKSPGSSAPTPLLDPHGAAHPVVAGPDVPLASVRPTT